MTFDQQEFDIRFEWGGHGVATLAPISDLVIIVDVMSFATSVEIAANRGAIVFPLRWRDDRAVNFAASVGAVLAGDRCHGCADLDCERCRNLRLVAQRGSGAIDRQGFLELASIV